MYECKSCFNRFSEPGKKCLMAVENGRSVAKDTVLFCPHCGSTWVERVRLTYDEWAEIYDERE